MSKKLCIILLFSLLIAVNAVPDSTETSVECNAAGRITILSLHHLASNSFSLNYRHNPSAPDAVMIGINTPYCEAGHLGDAGLAAEIRNPGYESLARLQERTFYRSDLRSISDSRVGISFHGRQDRWGAVLERREGAGSLLLRGGLETSKSFSIEGVLQFRYDTEGTTDESWYPETQMPPGGWTITPAARLKLSTAAWISGLTIIGSFSEFGIPGGLLAASVVRQQGPRRFRFRASAATAYFRDADGDRSLYDAGFSTDFRYRPSRGFQFAADLDLGRSREQAGVTELEGQLALGWRCGGWQPGLQVRWRYPELLPDQLAGEIQWVKGSWLVSIATDRDATDGWRGKVVLQWPLGNRVVQKSALLVEEAGNTDGLVWDVSSRFVLKTPEVTLILDISLEDLPRDWQEGPSSGSDLVASLRYIKSFDD